uniref:Uncharacterized protein n=1 Tax=Arundo donax TaxID=35708 RepID=A0A0A9ELS9_ARUDO
MMRMKTEVLYLHLLSGAGRRTPEKRRWRKIDRRSRGPSPGCGQLPPTRIPKQPAEDADHGGMTIRPPAKTKRDVKMQEDDDGCLSLGKYTSFC